MTDEQLNRAISEHRGRWICPDQPLPWSTDPALAWKLLVEMASDPAAIFTLSGGRIEGSWRGMVVSMLFNKLDAHHISEAYARMRGIWREDGK